jgi:hypothetical protein
MAFDFNEARAIIEAAKQKGLIREAGSPEPVAKSPKASQPNASEAGEEALPDWLKRGIRGPKAEAEE